MGIKYLGVNATGLAKAIPVLAEEGQVGGKLRVAYDKFVLTADLAAGDTIIMGPAIPEGARLIDAVITNDALGGACTIDVGWQASTELEPSGTAQLELAAATGFFSALPVSSASVAKAHGSTYEASTAFYGKILKAAVQPVIAEHAVSSGGTGKAVALEIYYVVD